MIISVAGKPSVGKSSFFKACTMAEVAIANYPFTTLKASEGVAYIRVDCVDKEFNVKCNPRFGYCINGKRFVPIKLYDVPGLIEGSYKGHGMGNQFLSELGEADAFIHIIDISGSTNEKGEPVAPLDYDPLKDVKFMENELDQWYLSIIQKGWERFARTIKQEKKNLIQSITKQLSGLKVTEGMVKEVVRNLPEDVMQWKEKELFELSSSLRKKSKPMLIAANKIDVPGSDKNFERLKKEFPEYIIIPCSADCELALKEAARSGFIDYIPGESKFNIKKELNEKQKKALDFIQRSILDVYGSTGVQECLDKAAFELLRLMAVFPGGVNKLADSEGRIMPDCFLLPQNSTA